MKKINKNRVIEQLNLRAFGQKGWLRSESCNCPKCGRSDKFGIKFEKSRGSVHCFHDDFSESIIKYLERIGRSDLVDSDGSISLNFKLKSLMKREEIEEVEIKETQLPIKFCEVERDEYLDSRNFLHQHYSLFRPGYCEDPLLNNYIILQQFQFGRRVGWQARSKYSKEWHKKNLEDHKKGLCSLKLRYKDAPGMDTSKILGGCNDITKKTESLILVEGLFDKTGVDRKLNLYSDELIRCCFTFGNKCSQTSIIRSFKSVRNIFLLYDQGTISQVKSMALELSKTYNVRAAVMSSSDDPGDASVDEILNTLEGSVSAIEFFLGRIESRIL